MPSNSSDSQPLTEFGCDLNHWLFFQKKEIGLNRGMYTYFSQFTRETFKLRSSYTPMDLALLSPNYIPFGFNIYWTVGIVMHGEKMEFHCSILDSYLLGFACAFNDELKRFDGCFTTTFNGAPRKILQATLNSKNELELAV